MPKKGSMIQHVQPEQRACANKKRIGCTGKAETGKDLCRNCRRKREHLANRVNNRHGRRG